MRTLESRTSLPFKPFNVLILSSPQLSQISETLFDVLATEARVEGLKPSLAAPPLLHFAPQAPDSLVKTHFAIGLELKTERDLEGFPLHVLRDLDGDQGRSL